MIVTNVLSSGDGPRPPPAPVLQLGVLLADVRGLCPLLCQHLHLAHAGLALVYEVHATTLPTKTCPCGWRGRYCGQCHVGEFASTSLPTSSSVKCEYWVVHMSLCQSWLLSSYVSIACGVTYFFIFTVYRHSAHAQTINVRISQQPGSRKLWDAAWYTTETIRFRDCSSKHLFPYFRLQKVKSKY